MIIGWSEEKAALSVWAAVTVFLTYEKNRVTEQASLDNIYL